MSIVGAGLGLAALGKASVSDEGILVAAIEGIATGIESIGNAFSKIKKGIEQKAERKANIVKFNEILEHYKKIAEHKKPGTIETFRNKKGNTVATFIHTKNGPVVRIERSLETVSANGFPQKSISYTGIRKITDEKGNEVLAYINNATQGSRLREDRAERAYSAEFFTSGSILTEKGDSINLNNATTHDLVYGMDKNGGLDIHNPPHMPTDGMFEFIGNLEAEFNKMLQEAQKNIETSNENNIA